MQDEARREGTAVAIFKSHEVTASSRNNILQRNIVCPKGFTRQTLDCTKGKAIQNSESTGGIDRNDGLEEDVKVWELREEKVPTHVIQDHSGITYLDCCRCCPGAGSKPYSR